MVPAWKVPPRAAPTAMTPPCAAQRRRVPAWADAADREVSEAAVADRADRAGREASVLREEAWGFATATVGKGAPTPWPSAIIAAIPAPLTTATCSWASTIPFG